MTERDFATNVVRTLQAAGHQAVFAGGCVRDQLLGLEPDDYDVATDATPERVQALFRRTIAIGASFGVIEVLGPKLDGEWLKVQVATFRSDGTYSDGRRPDSVTYGNAEEDAKRRDFTINGMFYDPVKNEVLDYVGGMSDLNGRFVRAIGNPRQRFREDKLRLLRAVRMTARFEFGLDAATLMAMTEMASEITLVSAERIADEIRKMLVPRSRLVAMDFLHSTRLLEYVLPEVEYLACRGPVSRLPGGVNPVLALSLMSASMDVARSIAHRLKLSNDEMRLMVWLVTHRGALARPHRQSRLYPLLANEWNDHLIETERAQGSTPPEDLDECLRLLADPTIEIDPPPLLTGDDFIAAGWKPGPQFKSVLDQLRAAQLDGAVNSREDAWVFANSLRK